MNDTVQPNLGMPRLKVLRIYLARRTAIDASQQVQLNRDVPVAQYADRFEQVDKPLLWLDTADAYHPVRFADLGFFERDNGKCELLIPFGLTTIRSPSIPRAMCISSCLMRAEVAITTCIARHGMGTIFNA